MEKFWNFTKIIDQEGQETRILELRGTIAEESWFEDEVSPKMFKDELNAGSGPVVIWLNSPGGDCLAASQIYAMLLDYKDEVIVKIDGLAASAASVIAMAADEVYMAPTALMMIHNPATLAFGDHGDMQKAIDLLGEVKESIINAYELKTHLSRDELSRMMEEETWMNANKAIELGFADKLLTDEKPVKDLSNYAFSSRKVEMALINKIKEKQEQETVKRRSVEDLKNRLNTIKNYL